MSDFPYNVGVISGFSSSSLFNKPFCGNYVFLRLIYIMYFCLLLVDSDTVGRITRHVKYRPQTDIQCVEWDVKLYSLKLFD